MQETQFSSLDWEDSPREGNDYPLKYLTLRIPWTGEPGGLQSIGLFKSPLIFIQMLSMSVFIIKTFFYKPLKINNKEKTFRDISIDWLSTLNMQV